MTNTPTPAASSMRRLRQRRRESGERTITAKLSAAEYDALRIASRLQGVTIQELAGRFVGRRAIDDVERARGVLAAASP